MRDATRALLVGVLCALAPLATGATGATAAPATPPTPAPGPAGDAAEALLPFTSAYAVAWNGINAGTATLQLARDSGTHWLYRSRIEARGLFRLVFPDDIVQSSRFVLDGDVPRPTQYAASDGARDRRRDINLEFNWATHRITGTAEQAPVDIALKPGTLDPMSVQIAMIRALATGRTPTHFLMIDKNEIKDFLYAPQGSEHLHTALGDLDTVIWSSSRPDSDRVTRMWYAPSLGYLPVRAEQLRSGKLQVRMLIRTLARP